MTIMRRFVFLCLWMLAPACAATFDFDLVVYGGTAGGVMTAVAGARQQLKTVLLEPRGHIGGMATGGLSRTDVGKRESDRRPRAGVLLPRRPAL